MIRNLRSHVVIIPCYKVIERKLLRVRKPENPYQKRWYVVED